MAKPKGNKSFTNLSQTECIEAYKAILANADRLYNDAKFLSEKSSYGTSISLLILSAEESIKALILIMDGYGLQLRNNIKGLNKIFLNHKLRYPVVLILSCFHVISLDLKFMYENYLQEPHTIAKCVKGEKLVDDKFRLFLIKKINEIINEIKWFSNAEVKRQIGFYVDYRDGIISPLQITENDFNDVLIRIDGSRRIISYLLDKIESNPEQYKNQLSDLNKRLICEKNYNRINENLSIIKKNKQNPYSDLLNMFGWLSSKLKDYKSPLIQDINTK
ncbi:MAG: AbiV family abortive infection protein [Bacteroidales bacterium]|jgi:AbiV family abortive infection protein